jgi:Phospholipase B
MRRYTVWTIIFLTGAAVALLSQQPGHDPRLKGAFRQPAKNGWIYVHLQGLPADIGFQHGYLLAPEIADAQKVIALELTHDTKKDWQFFRGAAKDVLWPHIQQEYRDELRGITEGLNARGVKLDQWDVVAMNAWLEMNPYYVNWYDKQHQITSSKSTLAPAERCSAFVATGSYTKDGKIVMGHNAWTGYLDGQRWNIIFDLVPAKGHRILMDGFPGLIHSADDFGVNSAGILVTETTISRFSGWDPNGIPEFVRARKALQHSASIDDFSRIMSEGNNGGYANNWLVADRKTNEVASLELGLKNVNLRRTKDGYFGGANFPVNAKLIHEETEFSVDDMGASANARRVRWDQLMAEYKGKIDVKAGQKFLSDHYDTYAKKTDPNERTLCGHIDLSPRGSKPWQPEFGIAGAVQAKVTDAAMAERMSLTASMGHPCGITFKAAEHLKRHPEFNWQKEYLRDLNSHAWTTFSAAR